jgi:hypothetical protein
MAVKMNIIVTGHVKHMRRWYLAIEHAVGIGAVGGLFVEAVVTSTRVVQEDVGPRSADHQHQEEGRHPRHAQARHVSCWESSWSTLLLPPWLCGQRKVG